MEINIISLENRKGTKLGETKTVRRGYARYLIRNKRALAAHKENIERFSQMRASLEKQEADKLMNAEAHAEKLKGLSIQISSRAAEEGQLYGSLGAREIADAVTKAGVPVDRQDVLLSTGHIRHTGDHEVLIHLHDQVKTKITIQVVPVSS